MTSIVRDVVAQIAKLWNSRLCEMSDYLKSTFGVDISEPYSFKQLVITQIGEGDIDANTIGFLAIAKWIVDGGTMNPVPYNYTWNIYETDSSGDLWVTPYYTFFIDNDRLLLSEHYGTWCVHRLRGEVKHGNSLSIDWSSAWHSTKPGV